MTNVQQKRQELINTGRLEQTKGGVVRNLALDKLYGTTNVLRIIV
jgi:hypothetical protein